MVEKIQLTKEGYENFQKEYRQLIDVTREEVKRQLIEARAQGDLSENADYDAARARQAEVEGRIVELENILHNAIIIDENKKHSRKIALGSTIKIKNLSDGSEHIYTITGTSESNPTEGKISNECPLGRALIGQEKGKIVTVKAKKEYQVEILSTNVGK